MTPNRYFALNVPAGLGLYWLTNNVLTTGQQVYLRNFGGASVNVVLPDQKLKYGTAIRSGLKADPAAMQIISAFDGDGGVGAAAEGEARAAANTIPAARDVPEPNSNGSGAREAVVDLQSTRRAKRLRIGRIMQVYTESQTRGPEGKAISAELET